MNIPAIVALHHSRTLIREDELIIVDGTQGVVIVNPDRTCSPSTGCARTRRGSSATS